MVTHIIPVFKWRGMIFKHRHTVCGYPLGRSSGKTLYWSQTTCKRCLAARQNKRLEGQTHTHRFRKARGEPVYRPHPQKYYKID